MNYAEWEATVPESIKGDRLWTVKAYRLSLLLADLAWHDVSKLAKDRRTISVANQLYRSVGSVRANYAEGYSYSSGGNRARYLEYALGSARESREWYYTGRHILGDAIVQHRISLLENIIKLLITTIPEQRSVSLREQKTPYEVDDINIIDEDLLISNE